MNNATRLLQQALIIVAERGQSYGDATKLFNQIAERWSLALGVEISAAQVVLCMLDLKLVRLSNDPTHMDSIVDVAIESQINTKREVFRGVQLSYSEAIHSEAGA